MELILIFKRSFFVLIIMSLIQASPGSKSFYKVEVKKSLKLKDIPSGSGVEYFNKALFITGDDSPWLFKVSASDYQVKEKYLISDKAAVNGRVAKLSKPDFEAIAVGKVNGKDELFIFGSGGLSPERDNLVIFNPADSSSIKSISLKSLYNDILKKASITQTELNIEAAVVIKEDLYLFNRGKNFIIKISWKSFLKYIENAQSLDLEIYPFKLPLISGVEAGFSGATRLGSSSKILFTASVERTKDWIKDGLVLGSFVGVIDLKSISDKVPAFSQLITDSEGKVITEKIESITFLKYENKRSFNAIAIADNDDGTTSLMELKFSR